MKDVVVNGFKLAYRGFLGREPQLPGAADFLERVEDLYSKSEADFYAILAQNPDESWYVLSDVAVKVERGEDEFWNDEDHLVQFVNNHRKYWFFGVRPATEPAEEPDAPVVLPVYYIDHSGVALSTRSYGDHFDSGLAGYAYITQKSLDEMRKWNDENAAKSEEAFLESARQQVEHHVRYSSASSNGALYQSTLVALHAAVGSDIEVETGSGWYLEEREALTALLEEITNTKYLPDSVLTSALNAVKEERAREDLLQSRLREATWIRLRTSFPRAIPHDLIATLVAELAPTRTP